MPTLKPTEGDTSRTLGWKMLLESGKVAVKRHEFDKAEKLFERALESAERRHSPTDVIIGHILMEIAEFHLNQHAHDKAFACYERVRQILAKSVGDEDPDQTPAVASDVE